MCTYFPSETCFKSFVQFFSISYVIRIHIMQTYFIQDYFTQNKIILIIQKENCEDSSLFTDVIYKTVPMA